MAKATRARTGRLAATLDSMRPETEWEALHKLQARQIELEMQNDELSRAQVELDAARKRYFELYELAVDGILQGLPDGRISGANAQMQKFAGRNLDQLLGRHVSELFDPGELMTKPLRFDLLDSVRAVVSERILLRPDGTGLPIEMHSKRMPDGAYHAIFRDISERKRTAEALRESACKAEAAALAKSQFLAMMSHELRTPLHGVIGFAQILAASDLDDDQRDCVKSIADSGEHLLRVVNDILDFSSLEKGKLALNTAPIRISDLLESACVPVLKTASDRGLEFSRKIASGTPAMIAGDERRIRQILLNLLGNAVKLTEKGSVRLRVAPASDGGQMALVFSVEDTGPGIAPGMLDLLFEPFTQCQSPLQRNFEGSGLGLTISRRLADAMGGSITVASTLGKGSTFTFRLPLQQLCSVRETPSVPATHPAPIATPANLLVLVVEDDKVSSRLAGRMLQSLGYRAEFALNGREALDAFVPGRFSCILMDMWMPHMNGIEATGKIRAQESGVRVPIIALTANVMSNDRERCLAAGMDDFISKPIRMDELAAKLHAFCGRA